MTDYVMNCPKPGDDPTPQYELSWYDIQGDKNENPDNRAFFVK